MSARYVGSPVLEQMPRAGHGGEFRRRLGLARRRPTLALLPGSRMSEIRRILPAMVEAARALVAGAPGPAGGGAGGAHGRARGDPSRFEGSGVTPRAGGRAARRRWWGRATRRSWRPGRRCWRRG